MKVLVLASTFPRWAGDRQPTFILDLARALQRERIEVSVLAPADPAAPGSEDIDGIRVERFRYAPLRRLETLAYGSGMLANIRGRPWRWLLLPLFLAAMVLRVRRACARGEVDVVHAHWIIPQGLCAAVALASLPRHRRPPLLLTAHGADVGAFDMPAGRALKRWTLRQASAATAVSSVLRDRIGDLGGPAVLHGTQVEPMGIAFPATGPRTATREGCCFVGRFVPKKGVVELVEAWAIAHRRLGPRLPVLTLAGDGELREAVEQRIGALQLQDKVHLAGWLERDALTRLVGGSLFTLMPSRRTDDGDDEGLGLVALESLALGTPVIACEFAALADIRAVAGDGLRVAGGTDPDRIAEAVIDAIEHPFAADWTASGIPQAVRERFAWRSVGARYAAMLRSLAAPAAAGQ